MTPNRDRLIEQMRDYVDRKEVESIDWPEASRSMKNYRDLFDSFSGDVTPEEEDFVLAVNGMSRITVD